MGFLLSAAEHESGDRNVELPIFLQLVNDVADSLFGGKLLDLVLELFRVLRIKALGDIETMGDSIRIVVGAKVFRNTVVWNGQSMFSSNAFCKRISYAMLCPNSSKMLMPSVRSGVAVMPSMKSASLK